MSRVEIRRWKRWLEIIYVEIVELSHQRRVFREISTMFEQNPALRQADPTIWQWLAENYAAATAVAVRRQADYSPRKPVASLYSLLTEIAEHPEVVTREWFVRQYVRNSPAMTRDHWRRAGEHDFDRFAANHRSKRISSRKVLSDRRRLRRAEARVRHYVNKRIAHRALRGYRGPATFADLNAAIDELGRLLARYRLLLDQGGMVDVEPIIQGDWLAAARVPWIK